MKNTKTIRSQLLGVVIDTVLVSLVLVIMTLVIYQHMEKGYETSTEQMLLLNSYYHTGRYQWGCLHLYAGRK